MSLTKKQLLIALIVILAAGALVWGAIFAWNNFRGAGPAFRDPGGDIAEEIKKGQNNTDFPLEVPDGFTISVLSEAVSDPRVIIQDSLGNFWVSSPDEGAVYLLQVQNGEVIRAEAVFTNLNRPHGLAIDPSNPLLLYIAETDKVSRVNLYTESALEKLVDLPAGGRHFTRTIVFGSDGRLYVSIGSSCDTCAESDERRAAIYSMEPDGSDFKKYADGLRNAVFMSRHPITGKLWVTEMGRDFLGDNLPPDEINIVEEGRFYGWPWYYGDNVRDENFRPGVTPAFSRELTGSHIDIQAHSAPLGLDFVPEGVWGAQYNNDLIVAYHGSWNRTEPTGYKLVRFKLDDNGNYQGREDFISGWLQGNSALGRPADVFINKEGEMYVTDDHAGLIYKIIREKN